MVFDEKFFVAIATVTFFVLTFKPLKKSLLGIVDSRIDKIKKDLAEAERLKNEALQFLNEAKEKLEVSESQGKNIIEHAHKEAEQIINNTKIKLERDIETRKKLALQKIQSFEENAINELKKNISNITVVAAAQTIEESGDEDSFKKLINTSLEKLSKTVH